MFAALALAAAGCGDDDEGDTGESGTPLTKEEWIAQADAICEQADQDIDQQVNELFGGQQPSQEEIDQFTEDVLVPSLRDQAADIRALTPPEGEEDEINQLLDDLDSAIDEVESDPSLLQASGNEDPFPEVNQEAEDLGLKVCGQG